MGINNLDVKKLLGELTLEEKASLCSGYDAWLTERIDRLNIPHICMSDGPHGLRKESPESDAIALKQSYPATCFPPAVNLANTWNKKQVAAVAEAIAKEARNQHVSVVLGPGINIKRSPLCGRNFEYFSEDPYLSGVLATEYINACQSQGIGTSLKHFAVNNQEYRRMSISAAVDERALREIYLTAFEMCVKESQPWTIMCSYNKIDGVYSSDNKKLLSDILRDEWGYKGIIVSDWMATNDRVQGIRAGMDLEMPTSNGVNDRKIVEAVKNGELSEKELDKVVLRLLELISKCPDFEVSETLNFKTDHSIYENSYNIARDVARESFVLMKNEEAILPLQKSKEIAVIGGLAADLRHQGSGSSRINSYKVTNILEGLENAKQKFKYEEGYSITSFDSDSKMEERAIALAKSTETVVFCLGLINAIESEGFDRKDLFIPDNQLNLLKKVYEVNKNVVAVLFGGSPVDMSWQKNAKAILNAYLPGEAGGDAICDVLFGDYSPSGKLAETYPEKLEDYLGSQYYIMGPLSVEHRESIFVGYRYYDSAEKNVSYPFGYGLSYSSFEYSNIKVSSNKIKSNESVTVSFDVKNTGSCYAGEIAQVYVHKANSNTFRAYQELKGFDKVFLEPGQTKNISITLDPRSFAFWDTQVNDWMIEEGEYSIFVSQSSRDIKLEEKVFVEQVDKNYKVISTKDKLPSYYNLKGVTSISDEEFDALYAKPRIKNVAPKRGEFDSSATIGDLQCCLIGKLIAKVALPIVKKQIGPADFTTLLMIEKGMMDLPLRALPSTAGGIVGEKTVDGLLMWANKKRLKASFKLVAAVFEIICNLRAIKKKEKAKQKLVKEQKANQ